MMAGLVARGKWDAWTTQKGASKDEAAAKYIELIKELCGAIEEPPKEKKPKVKKERKKKKLPVVEK